MGLVYKDTTQEKTEKGSGGLEKIKKYHQKCDTTEQAKIQVYHHEFANWDKTIDL